MSKDHWSQVRTLFQQALDQPEERRAEFLAEACEGDTSLLESVQGLLDNDTEAFLSTPAYDLVPLPDVEAGEHLGPYRLIRELGSGGMGRVFLAERDDGVYEKQVALKFVRHDVRSQAAIERFAAERRMLARLQHANIAALLDGGISESGIPYLVMEYVQGTSIHKYCDEQRLTIRERIELFVDVCAAVQHAHQQLIIHRDLKPGNILVTEDGNAKLLDFGIAKLLADETGADTPRTRTGMRMMTPEYASPEQINGESITTASDVYALGILLYEMITGRRPFAFGTHSLAEIARVVMDEHPRRPSTLITEEEGKTQTDDSVGHLRSTDPGRLVRQVQGDLDTVILKALHREPERRYPTAAAFGQDLERYLKGLPVAAKADSVGYRTRKFVERNRVGVLATVTGLLVLVSSSIFYGWSITKESARARTEANKSEQVVSFLQNVFGSARPENDGRAVTVLEVIEEAEATLAEELVGQPDVEAAVRATIGYTYQGLGLFERSQSQLVLAREILESQPDTEPRRLAQAVADIARLQSERGVYDSANAHFTQALAMYRRDAPEDEGLDDTLNDFGGMLAEQGHLEEAVPLLEEALEIRRVRLGPDAVPVALVLTNIAYTNLALGRPEIAGEQLAETIRIYSAGEGHEYELATVLQSLAYTRVSDDLDSADSLFQRTLELRRQIHGDRHPEVALGLHNLASQIHFRRGEYGRAEEMLLEALEIHREAFPEGHLLPSVSHISLGRVRLAQDRVVEAESTLRTGLEMQERLLPDDHAFLAQTRSLLGESLTRQGRYSEAEPLLLRGLAAFESGERGDMNHELEDTRRRLVELYEAWGRPALAAPFR